MALPTYTLEIDIARDENYNHANSDLTSRVTQISWGVGMNQPFDQIGRNDKLSVTLDNSDGALSQDDNAASYYGQFKPGTLVRLQATHNSVTYTLYTGQIASPLDVQPDHPTQKPPTAVLMCSGRMDDLLMADYNPPLLTDSRVDEGIEQLLDDVSLFTLPYGGDFFIIGHNVLGDNLSPESNSSYFNLEQADTTLPFIGDTDRGQGQSAQGYLQELLLAEPNSRLWWGADGVYQFHNTNYDPDNNTLDANMTEADFTALVPMVWKIYNHITVGYEPREVGTVGSVLASRSADADPIKLKDGDEKTINLKFSDPDNPDLRIAGKDVIDPVIGTDVIGNSAEDGTGTDESANIGVFAEIKANNVSYTLANSSGSTIYVTTLQVRGTPLIRYQPEEVEAKDATSISNHGYRKNPQISASLISTDAQAQVLADEVLARHKDEQHYMRNATLRGKSDSTNAHWAKLLGYDVGNKINITEASLDHDENYTIVGLNHTINVGQGTHDCTWLLRPISGTVNQPSGDTYDDKISEYADNGNDLARYYKHIEGSGTQATDASANAQHGTYSGVTHNASGSPLSDASIEWDGTGTEYCDVYHSSLFADLGLSNGGNTNTLTFVQLVKVHSAHWSGSSTGTLLRLYGDANNEIKIEAIGGTGFKFTYKAGGTESTVTCDASSPTGWVQVAMTIDEAANEMKCYLNKAQVGTTQTIGTWGVGSLSSTQCVIGAADKSDTNVLDGEQSRTTFADHVFTLSEISDLATKAGTTTTLSCAAGSDAYDDLVVSYGGSNLKQFLKLNDAGSGSTADDTTSLENDGTFNGLTNTSSGSPMGDDCITFDDDSDDVEIQTAGLHGDLDLAGGDVVLTLGCLFNPDSTNWTQGHSTYLFRLKGDSNNEIIVSLHPTNGLVFEVDIGGTSHSYSHTAFASSTGWHQVVVTIDTETDEEIKCYLDDTLVQTISSVTQTWGASNFSSNSTVLGNISHSGTERNFIGDMARYFASNSVYTGTQVSNLWDARTEL